MPNNIETVLAIVSGICLLSALIISLLIQISDNIWDKIEDEVAELNDSDIMEEQTMWSTNLC